MFSILKILFEYLDRLIWSMLKKTIIACYIPFSKLWFNAIRNYQAILRLY